MLTQPCDLFYVLKMSNRWRCYTFGAMSNNQGGPRESSCGNRTNALSIGVDTSNIMAIVSTMISHH